MLITEQIFNAVFPKAKVGIYGEIAKQIEKAGCKTKAQQAMFLAQCGHETAGFTRFVENLNYSTRGLLAVFPKYFNASTVAGFAMQAERIANRVYANRMGNGDEASGDGYKYRGRGIIQITGRKNYIQFEKWLGFDIKPEQVATQLDLIVLTGVWYWQVNNLASLSDIQSVTKRINGGYNGLAERGALFERLMK